MAQRRWLSFSLRSLLILLTVVSVVFAWALHYRGEKVREQQRIVELLAGHETHVNFRYSLLGCHVPVEARWLWRIAIPDPDVMFLRPEADNPLPPEFCEIARRCSQIEYEGAAGGTDAYLRACVSAATEVIKVTSNGVSTECLAFVGECPQLREVEVGYISLTSKSLEALLNHPRIERLAIHAEVDDLSLLGELRGPNALERLELHLDRDWQRTKPMTVTSFLNDADLPSPTPGDSFADFETSATGDFAWLKQCDKLSEITLSMPQDAKFFDCVGKHLGGVERLNMGSSNSSLLESLGTWGRLRHLCLDGPRLSDEHLARLVELCPQLHTLEIDNFSEPVVGLTAAGLRALQGLTNLKRLRLGMCNLQQSHMAVIAEQHQLEELSLEGAGITDVTIAPLTKLPKLWRISLERTKATGSRLRATPGDWDERRPYRFEM